MLCTAPDSLDSRVSVFRPLVVSANSLRTLRWRAEAEPLDPPLLVVGVLEDAERFLELGEVVEVPDPEQLLLEGAKETLDAAVPFRLAHERRRRIDAEEVGARPGSRRSDVLTAVVVTQRQADRRVGDHAPEMLTDALSQGLQCLEPSAGLGGMKPDAFSGAVIDRAEDRDLRRRPGSP